MSRAVGVLGCEREAAAALHQKQPCYRREASGLDFDSASREVVKSSLLQAGEGRRSPRPTTHFQAGSPL